MNFILTSPHFPTNFQTFAVRLHQAGFTTLGIADEPYDQLSPELRAALTEYYRVDDMQDYDQMYRAVAYFAHKYGRIDRIESNNEFWLETDARLRTDFNIPGLKAADMDPIKHKSKMKAVFRQHGIPVARGRVFVDQADGQALAKELGLPVIIKPDSGVGASNTYRITTQDQLDQFFKEADQNVTYIMEEFIEGDIVTFDGLTDQDGKIVFSSSLYHNIAVLDIVAGDSDMFYHISRQVPQDIQALGEKCVAAFGIKERFFHFEFFRLKKDGSLMALEINCRPPGGATIDMFNYANDFDIFSEYANIVKENQFKAPLTRPYHCAYISRKDKYHYLHSEADIYQHYGQYIVDKQTIPGVFSSIMGNVGYILKVAEEDKLLEMLSYIQAR